ncbi:MAG: HAD-IIIA family hydrolase [Candidatus Levybacteria bacterium]|nr:HAD-IIIA family hydrolase [Candidatus Levybacteria bacterium]
MKGFIEQIYRNTSSYKGVVFLDRDGTINDEELEVLPTVVHGIRLLNKKKIAVVVITNQPVVARGLITIDELKKINNTLVGDLKKRGAYIDAVYSCPHHPEKHHPDIPKHAINFRIKCHCRKPGVAMHKKAMSVFGSKKIIGVIGDHTRDIAAGKKLSAPTVVVLTGDRGEDGLYDITPDFISDNFLDAVQKLF